MGFSAVGFSAVGFAGMGSRVVDFIENMPEGLTAKPYKI